MNTSLLTLGLIAELALVVGQLLLKRAMHPNPLRATTKRRTVFFILSIAAQTVYFFLWLGLLEGNDLSRVYPFDAASAVLLVVAAVFLLHERLTPRAWTAISFILAGIVLISSS